MTNSVAIFRLNFPEVSETFIRAQLSTYVRYEPEIYTKRRLADSPWPVHAVSDHGQFAERSYLLSRSTQWHTRNKPHTPRLVHAHFGVDGVYALPLAEHLGVPLITTFHGYDVLTKPSWWLRHPTIPIAVYRLHLAQLRNRGARFLAVSRFVEAALIRSGFPPDRIIQHYIGVDTAKFSPVDKSRRQRPPYILSVGRHVQFKGLDVLLRAFARIAHRYPDMRLLQVGAGPLTADLKRLAVELDLSDRVEFLGARTQEEIVRLLQEAEIFALPSLTQESGQAEALGIVFNEASACGIPVAATRSGGIPEVVIDGETGLLCAEHDDQALAENLAHLLADAALRERLGRRGRQLVCDAFDLATQTRKLESIYDEVAA